MSLMCWEGAIESVVNRVKCSSLSPPKTHIRSVLGRIDLRVDMNAQAKTSNLVLWHIKSSCSSLKPDALPLKRGYRQKRVFSHAGFDGKMLITARRELQIRSAGTSEDMLTSFNRHSQSLHYFQREKTHLIFHMLMNWITNSKNLLCGLSIQFYLFIFF